jgi:hypothetical protein
MNSTRFTLQDLKAPGLPGLTWQAAGLLKTEEYYETQNPVWEGNPL